MPWVPVNHTTYLGWVGVWSPLLSEADDDVDKPPVVQQPLVGASLWHLLLLLLLHLWRLAAHLTGTGKRTVNFTCGRDSQASKQATHGVDQKAKRSAKQNKTKTRMEHRKKSLSLSLSRARQGVGKEGAREEDITPVRGGGGAWCPAERTARKARPCVRCRPPSPRPLPLTLRLERVRNSERSAYPWCV